jgi:outer membrane protein assembly factor BamB
MSSPGDLTLCSSELLKRRGAMSSRKRGLAFIGVVILCGALAGHRSAGEPAGELKALLGADGVRAGLCLHLGCGTGELTAALHQKGRWVVHGLSADPKEVAAARAYIQGRGLYGPVAVDLCDFQSLPYADSVANVILVENYASLQEQGLAPAEIVRVLAPYGTAFIRGFSGAVKGVAVSKEGPWTRLVKPRRKGTDEWTHYEHGPQRTSVSSDMVVEPPTGLRWISGPVYPYAMEDVGFVSTKGRNFYWYWAHHKARYTPRKEGSLIECRDAFNGALLWEKATPRGTWGANMVGLGDTLYVQLGGDRGLVALDAATGRELFQFKEARDHPESEILVKDGVLVQSANGVRAFDAEKGALLWEKPNELMAGDLILWGHDKLFYVFQEKLGGTTFLVAVDPRTGKEAWRAEQKMKFTRGKDTRSLSLISFYRDMIFMASSSRHTFHVNEGSIYAVSATDGALLWEYAFKVVGHKATTEDIFAIEDTLWVKTQGRGKKKADGFYVALDLKTGKEKEGQGMEVGYNRCYPDRGMTRYLLTGGFDFVDVKTGETHTMSAARGFCKTGFMVAQGLTFSFSNRCTCFNLVRGFLGLAKAAAPAVVANPTVVKGPAYGAEAGAGSVREGDWPCLRHDNARSSSTTVKLAKDLQQSWKKSVGGKLSSLTAAEGLVFAAVVDAHKVVALDDANGEVKWSFTAGGRVDSPPTIHQGLAFFGSADGWVYALRARDGELAWKLRAAPEDRRILVHGQIESLWPVPGSLLVAGDTLYFAAGRNTHTDGGLYYYAADPLTGKVKWAKQKTDKTLFTESSNDVMIQGKTAIYLGHRVCFEPQTGDMVYARDARLFAPLGLLVDCFSTGPVAREDILRRQWSYSPVAVRGRARSAVHIKKGTKGKFGIMAMEDGSIYGVSDDYEFDHKARRIWVRTLAMSYVPAGESKGWSLKLDPNNWMRAIVSTAETLVLAVQPLGDKPGELWLVAKADGRKTGTLPVGETPCWDGLAVAGGRLFVATEGGSILAFGPKP